MSNDRISRAGFGATLANVLTAIVAAPDLSLARRQDMASAVRTVARAFGRSPELVPADPALLGRRLAEISPAVIGVSARRWANVRSLLLKALALIQPVLPGRSQQTMSPAWLALHQALPCRGDAYRLARLLRWLTAREIAPGIVTISDLEAFGVALREESLSKNPERDWREISWVWNKAARTVDGWPDIPLLIEKKRDPYTLPWSAFPPSLKADVDRYLDRIAGRDLLQDLPFLPVRGETVEFRERQLRTFASALVHRGRPATTLGTLADLVESETLKEGLRFFLERNNGETSNYIFNIACTLKAVARHHVKADKDALDEIARIINRLKVPTKGMTRKNRDRLRPFDDPANVQRLIELPQRLMKEANSGKLGLRRDALLAQMAVAVAVDYVRALEGYGNSTRTILARLQELYEAALVMDPRQDWQWIRRIASIVRARHVPARDKRLKMVCDEELVELGLNLMAGAGGQHTERLRALAFRDGLLIALLALRPAMRRRNIAALQIGRHLRRLGSGWSVTFDEDETKTGIPPGVSLA